MNPRLQKISGLAPENNERGATLLEATVALPLFLIILVISFELLRLTYSYLTVQYVGREVLRQVVVGSVSAADTRAEIVALAGKFGVTIQPNNIILCPMGRFPNCTVLLSAAPTLHVLRIRLPVTFFMFGRSTNELNRGAMTIDTTLVGRMEPR